MAIDLRQLRYFVAVAETGSLCSAAAGTLRIAQSALSTASAQALEQACGGALMERSVRGIVLTESGELLLGARGVSCSARRPTRSPRSAN